MWKIITGKFLYFVIVVFAVDYCCCFCLCHDNSPPSVTGATLNAHTVVSQTPFAHTYIVAHVSTNYGGSVRKRIFFDKQKKYVIKEYFAKNSFCAQNEKNAKNKRKDEENFRFLKRFFFYRRFIFIYFFKWARISSFSLFVISVDRYSKTCMRKKQHWLATTRQIPVGNFCLTTICASRGASVEYIKFSASIFLFGVSIILIKTASH